MIKTRTVVDEVKVKEDQEKWTTWTAVCTVCGCSLTGTIAQLKAHRHDD